MVIVTVMSRVSFCCRPQVLVLSGLPENRPALVDFVSHVTKKIGLMTCGNIMIVSVPVLTFLGYSVKALFYFPFDDVSFNKRIVLV